MPPPETPAAPGGPALRGDLTQGPLVRTLLIFALPQLLGNVLQSLNGSINAIWVGRLLGEEALAATANANIVMFLLFALTFGFGMAATVRIGQKFGARDIDGARRAYGTSLALTAIIALTVSVAGWIGAPWLLDALATPGPSRADALTYLRVILLGVPAMMISLQLAMGLRGSGDSRSPLNVMIISSLIDVALNPVLILGLGPAPQMGIAGAATATLIASTVGVLAQVGQLYWRDLPLRLRGTELRYLLPRIEELRFLVSKGVPMGAQMLVISGAGVVMIGLVNREGLDTAAAYGALLQVWNYIGMPAMAIGAAVSAMIAQHIGAMREDRVDAISIAGCGANLLMTGALIALLLPFDGPVLQLFLGPGSAAMREAIHIQDLAIWTYLPFGVTIVLFGALRAYGVLYAQLLILLVSMYGVRLGAYYLLYPIIGSDALWYSYLLSSVTSVLMTMGIYAFGTWRKAMRARIAAREVANAVIA